ncbi:hypothetical protein [Rickettsia endosymbiont of Orchestes rusci]|uniref:hypothetical protein n=1 Tax=Rickettsia endosymbiont of Orchestes rusci TaxID=3066250 RepID=UPI00313B40F7
MISNTPLFLVLLHGYRNVIARRHWLCCMARSYPVIARRDVVSTRQSRKKLVQNVM